MRTLNLDFEMDGDYPSKITDWIVVQGTLNTNMAVHTCSCDNINPHSGNYLYESAVPSDCSSGCSSGDDGNQSIIKSIVFLMPSNVVTFHAWITAGGDSDNLYIGLYLASDDTEIAKLYGDDDSTWRDKYADVSSYAGQKVYIKIVDTNTGGWGHTIIDDIHFKDSDDNRVNVYPPYIAGQVTLNNSGVSGATVRVIDQTNKNYIGDTTTDSNGNYSIAVIEDNYHHVVVEYTDGDGNKYNAASLWNIKPIYS